MNELLEKTNLDDTVRKISDLSAYSYDTLSSLPRDVIELICHQFIIDNGITEKTYNIIRSALMVSLISAISDFMNVPLESLAELPIETKEIICGMYLMEHTDDEDNTELAEGIRQYL